MFILFCVKENRRVLICVQNTSNDFLRKLHKLNGRWTEKKEKITFFPPSPFSAGKAPRHVMSTRCWDLFSLYPKFYAVTPDGEISLSYMSLVEWRVYIVCKTHNCLYIVCKSHNKTLCVETIF